MTESTLRSRSIDQKRAEQAWKDVQSVKTDTVSEEYRSLVRGAPADIQISGLGQFLAFLRSKWKGEHEALYKHIDSWLKQQLVIKADLLKWISLTASTEDYRRATAETMAYLMWLKRFAEAEIEVKNKSKGE